MLRRITRSSGLLALSCLGLALAAVPPASGGASAGVRHAVTAQPQGSATPGIKPAFIYSQLDYLATRFQHREAGYRAGSAASSVSSTWPSLSARRSRRGHTPPAAGIAGEARRAEGRLVPA